MPSVESERERASDSILSLALLARRRATTPCVHICRSQSWREENLNEDNEQAPTDLSFPGFGEYRNTIEKVIRKLMRKFNNEN